MYQTRESDAHIIFIAIGIMFILSSIFLPMIVGPLLRESIYRPDRVILFSSGPDAYFVLIGAFLAIGAAAIVIGIQPLRRNIKACLSGLLITAGLAGAVLAIDSYYYADKSGFHYNNLWSIKEKSISWDQIDSLVTVYEKEGVSLKPDRLEFHLHSSRQVDFPFYPSIENKIKEIESMILPYGGKLVIETTEQ